MKRVAGCLLGLAMCGLGSGAASEDGFETILKQHEGRYTKHGWNHYGPGYFLLDPDTGVLESRGGMGLLWYAAERYGDFVLELEFKSKDGKTNSGIFLRVPEVPTSDDYIYHSFEIQIDEAAEGTSGTGAVYSAIAPSSPAAHPPGQWNRFRISFIGDHITVDLNDTRIIDWQSEPRGKVADWAPEGYIGLQNHHDPNSVFFRNIRIRKVDGKH